MKKRLLYSGIVLLAGILALAGCSSPLSDAIESQDGSSTGRVQILINGESGVRTLAPDTLGTAVYEVFYRLSSAPATQVEDPALDEDPTTVGVQFKLPAGTWDIRVVAKVDTTIIGEGTNSVTVEGGKDSTVSILIKPNPQMESGTFHYALDYSELVTDPTNVAKGYLSLTPYPDYGNTVNDSTYGAGNEIYIVLEDENLGGSNANGVVDGHIDLHAGIYTLDIRLTTSRSGYPIFVGDDHTNVAEDKTTLDSQNVDIHKTEIVYIYSGQTTSMVKEDYTFTDVDVAKLYFEGTLTLDQSQAFTKTYKPTTVRVYQYGRLLNVYQTNGDTSAVTDVDVVNPDTSESDWEVYVPSYELAGNKAAKSDSNLKFVFTLESDDGKTLYASVFCPIDDEHGSYNVDRTRTIRRVAPGIHAAADTGSSIADITVRSYKYNRVLNPASLVDGEWDSADLEASNVDVVNGTPILVQVRETTPADNWIFIGLEPNGNYSSDKEDKSDPDCSIIVLTLIGICLMVP
jgi:hypothetical protein